MPRISNVLNNDLLHAIIPELRTEIKLLAAGRSTLNSDFLPAYEHLKTRFAEFYDLPSPKTFTWQQFEYFLDINEFDHQLMLGPVLRQIMFDVMNTCEVEKFQEFVSEDDIEIYIDELTNIQSDGQYTPMGSDALFNFVADFFGYPIISHLRLGELKAPQDIMQYSAQTGRQPIHLYFDGKGMETGHVERVADPHDSYDFEHDESAVLAKVADLFRKKTLIHTKIGFALLTRYAHMIYDNSTYPDDNFSTTYAQFEVTLNQVSLFFDKIYEEGKFAKRAYAELGEPNQGTIDILDYWADLVSPISSDSNMGTYEEEPEELEKILFTPERPGKPSSLSFDNGTILSSIHGNSDSKLLDTPKRSETSASTRGIFPNPNRSTSSKKRDFLKISKPLFDSDSEDGIQGPHHRNRYEKLNFRSNLPATVPAELSSFWLRTMQFCLVLGGVCAIIALITCPPVATALGLTTMLGGTATEIATTATFLAGTSTLMAASIFAVRKILGEDNLPTTTPNLGMSR